LSGIIVGLLRWLLYILGFFSVMAFMISGLMFLTSGGNDKQVENAKRYMVWSVVGIVVALSGLIILNAVYWWLFGYTRF
jgi:formate hydrogenlyase subunit 3/multisubunit Na+/H+ antiporter MnhD subunit